MDDWRVWTQSVSYRQWHWGGRRRDFIRLWEQPQWSPAQVSQANLCTFKISFLFSFNWHHLNVKVLFCQSHLFCPHPLKQPFPFVLFRTADSAKTVGRAPSLFSEDPLLKSTENNHKEALSSKHGMNMIFNCFCIKLVLLRYILSSVIYIYIIVIIYI